ncbi:hypothetical protein [Streptosporangium sp. V21-05]|uniref:hypothetical protein n=1 Tax=Streptosporangium sp. V21-05 TaxID=3446115 RepID=UPI003F537370
MTGEIWIAVVACIGALGSAAFTAAASRRTARVTEAVETSKVDAAAFDRARAIYESALQTLEEQSLKLRERMGELNQQLAHEQDASAEMRQQIRDLRAQVDLLEETVADLRLQLSKADIRPETEVGEVEAP